MKRIRIVAATVAALAVLAGGGLYLRSSSAEPKPAAAAVQALTVPVATVQETEVNLWDEFSGRLEAVERVDVRSRVAGAVKSVHFTEGARVERFAVVRHLEIAWRGRRAPPAGGVRQRRLRDTSCAAARSRGPSRRATSPASGCRRERAAG